MLCVIELLPFCQSAAAKSLQSCSTLCNPIDGSPPGSLSLDSPGKKTGMGCHFLLQCTKVKSESKVSQSCPTLNDPMDCSPPGSSAHGIFQARVLEWGAIAFSIYICIDIQFLFFSFWLPSLCITGSSFIHHHYSWLNHKNDHVKLLVFQRQCEKKQDTAVLLCYICCSTIYKTVCCAKQEELNKTKRWPMSMRKH